MVKMTDVPWKFCKADFSSKSFYYYFYVDGKGGLGYLRCSDGPMKKWRIFQDVRLGEFRDIADDLYFIGSNEVPDDVGKKFLDAMFVGRLSGE